MVPLLWKALVNVLKMARKKSVLNCIFVKALSNIPNLMCDKWFFEYELQHFVYIFKAVYFTMCTHSTIGANM